MNESDGKQDANAMQEKGTKSDKTRAMAGSLATVKAGQRDAKEGFASGCGPRGVGKSSGIRRCC
jgi:hypothetical protein